MQTQDHNVNYSVLVQLQMTASVTQPLYSLHSLILAHILIRHQVTNVPVKFLIRRCRKQREHFQIQHKNMMFCLHRRQWLTAETAQCKFFHLQSYPFPQGRRHNHSDSTSIEFWSEPASHVLGIVSEAW